jgi:hypothetical protein
MASLLDRVRNICVSPATEWPIIEQERTAPAALVTGYLLPLAAVGAAAGFIGRSVVGAAVPFRGTFRVPVVTSFVDACLAVVATVVGCFVMAFIIDALAPTFGGRPDRTQALKTSVYSYTPGLVAAILTILPVLDSPISIVAGLYGLYLLYVGLPFTMKAPRERAVGYTAVIVICAILLFAAISAVFGALVGTGMFGRAII